MSSKPPELGSPLLAPLNSNYNTFHAIDISPNEGNVGFLSNARLVELLKEDLSGNDAKEKIKQIVENILRFSPYYAPPGRYCCNESCTWQSWTSLTAHFVAVGSALGYFTSQVWNSLPDGAGVGFVFLNIGVDIGTPFLLPWLEAITIGKLVEIGLISKRDKAVLKIQSYLQHLELFGPYQFDPILSGHTLADAEILKSTRKTIVSTLSATQLMKLQKELGNLQFKAFTGELLTKSQIYYLKFLQQIPSKTANELITSLKHVRKYIENDVTLFDEIVEIIHENQGSISELDNSLLKIGKELKIFPADASVEELGKLMKILIRTKVGNPASTIQVRASSILQYDSFKAKIKGNTIEIYLQDDEVNELEAYRVLFDIMDGKKATLSNQNVVPLIAIADFYHVEKCLRLCFEYLIHRQNEFDPPFYFDLLLCHAHFSYGMKETKKMFREKVKQVLLERDYSLANRLVHVTKRHRVNVEAEIDEILANLAIFRELLEYSLEPKIEIFLSACLGFFDKRKGNKEALMEIFNLWPPGEIPEILVERLQKGTQIHIVADTFSIVV